MPVGHQCAIGSQAHGSPAAVNAAHGLRPQRRVIRCALRGAVAGQPAGVCSASKLIRPVWVVCLCSEAPLVKLPCQILEDSPTWAACSVLSLTPPVDSPCTYVIFTRKLVLIADTACCPAEYAESLAQAVPPLAQLLAAPAQQPAITGSANNHHTLSAGSSASPPAASAAPDEAEAAGDQFNTSAGPPRPADARAAEGEAAPDESAQGMDDVSLHLEALHALTLLLPAPVPQVLSCQHVVLPVVKLCFTMRLRVVPVVMSGFPTAVLFGHPP